MSPELVPRAYPEDGSPIFRLKISLDEKNIVFYFCFIFSRSSSPSPSWVKKNHFAGIWSIQVSRQSRPQRQESTSLVEFIALMKR